MTRRVSVVVLALASFRITAPGALAQPRVTDRVSLGPEGEQLTGHSFGPSVSADGRYVTFINNVGAGFQRCAVSGDALHTHVYLRDRQIGATECVSRSSDGTPGNDTSFSAAVSGNGRFVVFTSFSSNLVNPATTPSRHHVYVRDRVLGTTQLVTIAADGISEANDHSAVSPRINHDGRFVVFASSASNLVPGGTIAGVRHVYRRDLTTGLTTLVSVAPDGTSEGDDTSESPTITPDGRFVAFVSRATNLLAGGDVSPFVADVFLRDMTLGTTEVVSLGVGGGPAGSDTYDPAISADARIVVFGSLATNLVPGVDGSQAIFVRNLNTHATEAIPIPASFPRNPSISADGRMVSCRAQTGSGMFPLLSHFLHDRAIQSTVFVAFGSVGGPRNFISPLGPALSADGRVIFVDSISSLLPLADSNDRMDVYAMAVPQSRIDIGVYRASTGTWLFSRAFDGAAESIEWGSPELGDLPVFADYDGDGHGDKAVYRPSTGEWLITFSSTDTGRIELGSQALQDAPVPADYDGDGAADAAVYSRSTGQWRIALSGGGTRTQNWGAPALGDLPVPADYDGDGSADVAVYRGSTGQWFILRSSGGTQTAMWGSPSLQDVPVPGDYDGDGRAEVGVYRATTGEWFVPLSTGGLLHATWGSPGLDDIPLAADYDDDGKTDLAVYRPPTGEWFIWETSRSAPRTITWGADALGDIPVTLPLASRGPA